MTSKPDSPQAALPALEWVRGYHAAREQAAQVALNACLVPPDGGSPSEAESAVCDEAARRIRAMRPADPEVKGVARRIMDARPHSLLTDDALSGQIGLLERLRAFGSQDTWVNDKVAELRAEQEARHG